MKKPSKQQLWDYFILVARVCLAWQLGSYGYAKLTEGQFGVTDEVMNLPLKDVSLFKLSWYMADHEPFKTFIGVSQLICAGLLLYNRTLLLGAFMSIPIWLNILVWDLSYMDNGLATAFFFRLSFFLLLTALIIGHYRERVWPAVRLLVNGISLRFRYPLWAYLPIPALAFCLDILAVMPNSLWTLLKHWMAK